jgi:HlyD family secretion protein
MTITRRKLITAGIVVLVGIALVVANFRFRRPEGPAVTVEAIQQRDLEAIVSASGRIRAKRTVNISANTMGRVTRLAINEGDRVRTGQFLLQIDPKPAQTAVQRGEAGLQASRSALQQARVAVESARVNLQIARNNVERQRELWAQQLNTREALDRAEHELQLRETELEARETEIATQEQRIAQEFANLESARYDLTKVTIDSPIDGIVTRRNIEEGETVLIGTMNNPGTVLLTVADMSVIEAEVEVDETDIPTIVLGQIAKVTVDAFPDRTFRGHVTEIGNSPIQVAGAQIQPGSRQATNFKVVVTLDEEIPDVRPGFSCTAEVTTATRAAAVSVPIQATTVREVVVDTGGQIVRAPETQDRRRRGSMEATLTAAELEPGQRLEELEGVFLFRDGKAVFAPVNTGIAGERYFEVLSGLNEGDQVITGPFSAVRELKDGAAVRLEEPRRR